MDPGSFPCLLPVWTLLYNILGPNSPWPHSMCLSQSRSRAVWTSHYNTCCTIQCQFCFSFGDFFLWEDSLNSTTLKLHKMWFSCRCTSKNVLEDILQISGKYRGSFFLLNSVNSLTDWNSKNSNFCNWLLIVTGVLQTKLFLHKE